MLYWLLVTVYVVVCLMLLLAVLLQQGKGGDIAAAFGGGGGQAAFGARQGATVLTKASFSDSLDAGFLDRAGLYALDFDFVRSRSLYFNAYVGVDETDHVQPIGLFMTYAGEQKGRMLYWLVPEDSSVQE